MLFSCLRHHISPSHNTVTVLSIICTPAEANLYHQHFFFFFLTNLLSSVFTHLQEFSFPFFAITKHILYIHQFSNSCIKGCHYRSDLKMANIVTFFYHLLFILFTSFSVFSSSSFTITQYRLTAYIFTELYKSSALIPVSSLICQNSPYKYFLFLFYLPQFSPLLAIIFFPLFHHHTT